MMNESSCRACSRELPIGESYQVRSPAGPVRLCRRCALLHGPLLLRSAKVAALVGALLVLLNQGDLILGAAPLPASMWWKIPLTYCIPFCVVTYGALANAKRPEG